MNHFFHAEFCPLSGSLLTLTPARESQPLVRGLGIQYQADQTIWGQLHGHHLARSPVVESVTKRQGRFSSILRTDHLQIKRQFKASDDSPLLQIKYEFLAMKKATLHGPGLLYMQLADDVNDVATDEKDLYFDGAELPGHRELPCWRVLYREGHRRGLLVATRSKRMMSHLLYQKNTIEVRPHVSAQQELDYTVRNIPITMVPGQRLVVAFEVGPWSAACHSSLLKSASLETPVKVKSPEPSTSKSTSKLSRMPSSKAGNIYWLADHVSRQHVADTFHPQKWLKLGLPWNQRRKILLANAGCRPPAIVIKPDLQGPYQVHLGGSRAATAGLQFSGDPYPIYRYGIGGTAFHSALHGKDQAKELSYGIVDMTGRSVSVIANHNGHWPARLDYLRFVPLTATQAAKWRNRYSSSSDKIVAGIPDCGDVFFNLMDQKTLDPRIIQGNIWEQKNAGINRLYWQMHGAYTGFHTRIGTRMPMICYGHGAFEPQVKAAVLFQRKHDLLALAAKTCRDLGMEFWGAMRMNSYLSGKRDDFFTNHPQYTEITEDGTLCGNKICLAIPQVSQYHRSILVEAAAYGLDGIMLGVLRHPPLLLYHPSLVSGYQNRFGKLPPRKPGRSDTFHRQSLPDDDDESRQWHAYRAQFMTDFVRKLKQDLQQRGLGHTKISVWVRPNHCLFDGIDLELWLDEKLCDEVVCDTYSNLPLDEPSPAWLKMVRSHVPLIRGIGFSNTMMTPATLSRVMMENYNGLCVYGSEQFAQNPDNQPLLDTLHQYKNQ